MLLKSLFKNETTGTQTDLMNPLEWFRTSFLGGQPTSSGQFVTAESSLQVGIVFSCVNILANSVAKLPFQLYKREGKKKTKDKKHPVYRLLEKRPNKFMTPFVFKHTVEVHRNLWGNAYINIQFDKWGFPEALWILNPRHTTPILDPYKNELWYHTVLPNGKAVKLRDTEIIHVKTLSTDGLKGKSMIEIAREHIGTSQASLKYKGKLFSNGAMNSGVLKIDGMLKKEAKELIREDWEAMHTGLDNAGRIAILDAGLDYKDIGIPPRDAQFIEGMQFDKNEIATIFNVPAYKVNNLEKATLNNVEQLGIEYLSESLDPILTQYEEEFGYKMLSETEQEFYFLKFAVMKLLRTDMKTRGTWYKTMSEIGGYSINDILEKEDENPIEGGDAHRVDLNHVDVKIADEYQLTKAAAGGTLKGGENDNEQGDEGSSEPVEGEESKNE